MHKRPCLHPAGLHDLKDVLQAQSNESAFGRLRRDFKQRRETVCFKPSQRGDGVNHKEEPGEVV